jgi:hypothetical protein
MQPTAAQRRCSPGTSRCWCGYSRRVPVGGPHTAHLARAIVREGSTTGTRGTMKQRTPATLTSNRGQRSVDFGQSVSPACAAGRTGIRKPNTSARRCWVKVCGEFSVDQCITGHPSQKNPTPFPMLGSRRIYDSQLTIRFYDALEGVGGVKLSSGRGQPKPPVPAPTRRLALPVQPITDASQISG